MPQSFRLQMEKYVFVIAVISCSLGYLYQSNNYECNWGRILSDVFAIPMWFKYVWRYIVTCRSIARERAGKHVSWDKKMKVIDCWKADHYCGSNTHFPRIPLDCISGRSDKNALIRTWGVIRSRRTTRREDSGSPVRMEWVLVSHLLWDVAIHCD
jgi:hypothetical protein